MFLALLSFAGFTRRQVDTMGIKAFVKLQRIYTRMQKKTPKTLNKVVVFLKHMRPFFEFSVDPSLNFF